MKRNFRRLILQECARATEPARTVPELLTAGRIFKQDPDTYCRHYLLWNKEGRYWPAIQVSGQMQPRPGEIRYWNFKCTTGYVFYDSIHVL